MLAVMDETRRFKNGLDFFVGPLQSLSMFSSAKKTIVGKCETFFTNTARCFENLLLKENDSAVKAEHKNINRSKIIYSNKSKPNLC